ncbi:MAG: DNA primase [Clostridiales bacterium]|jgi:DNA primase|nr:DNA primase [Clostridiales bacterium]
MANFIPPDIIDEVVSKTDIVELISNYLVLKKQGKNFVAICPFHAEDTPSFSVSPEKQIFYCFGCQKGGNALNFVMEMESLTLPEAAEKLASRVGVVIPRQEYTPAQAAKTKEKNEIYRMHTLAAEFYQSLLAANMERYAGVYLKKRNVSAQTAAVFMLGYAPEEDWEALFNHLNGKGFAPELMAKAGLVSQSSKNGKYYDKFHGRLIFPICDYRGQVIAFGGRIIGEGQPKYLNSTQTPIYNKSEHLYGLNAAGNQIRQLDLAIIMEGYMDVAIAHEYGVTNAVASLGTAFTPSHARLIQRYTTNVLLAYDGDTAGTKAATRGLDILREQGLNVRVLSLPEGQDPDDFLRAQGKEGWDRLVADEAKGVLEFLLDQALAKYPIKSVTDKSLIVKELLPAISKTRSQVERESFIRELANKLSVSTDTIYADLRKSGFAIVPPAQKLSAIPPAENMPIATRASSQLLRLMLSDEEIFAKAIEELGPDFGSNPQESQLIKMIIDLGNYDFQIVSLLHRFDDENEGLRQFLLKLLQVDIPEGDMQKLTAEYICACKITALQKRIGALNEQLKSGQGDLQAALREIEELNQELHKLKG